MQIRPCIDLKDGKVVQIVGSTLSSSGAAQTNFVATNPPKYYAELFRNDQLKNGHVIALGPGNEQAIQEILQTWPGGFQYGGGVTLENAKTFLDLGASHVILTSWLFPDHQLCWSRCEILAKKIGKRYLVFDLSCRKRENTYYIMCNRWQTWTDTVVCPSLLEKLSRYCDEFLVHAVDVEGKKQGIEEDLLPILTYSPIEITYAGGIRNFDDLETIERIGQGRIHATIGSALDIFGGHLSYRQLCQWHHTRNPKH